MEVALHSVNDKVEVKKTYLFSLFPEIQDVTIIGTGNVATWLVFALKKAKIHVSQIYGRNDIKCHNLASSCGAEAVTDLSKLKNNSHLYIFSLKDDCYDSVISQIPFELPMAVLTAGSVSQNVLAPVTPRFGTLYPCQTMSSEMDFSRVVVPLCVEGCDSTVESQLLHFAARLSEQVIPLHEKERECLHLAAVFACNFSNALYGIAFDILKNANIEPKVLLPLLQNTLKKLETMPPADAQTGPAIRNDKSVINKHLSMISDEKWRDIYEKMTEEIISQSVKKS